MIENQDLSFQTMAIHMGESPDLSNPASIPDITMSNTFLADPKVSFSAENLEEDSAHTYTRWSNPTIEILEKKVAALENGEAALAFSSGVAAVTSLMLNKLKSEDRMIISDVTYAGIREFANDILDGLNIDVVPVDLSNIDSLKDAFQKPVKLVFAESPCNPILRLTDIKKVANIAHENGAQLAVDSTFGTPCVTRPISLGADYVIHSMTKYLGGHGDAMGGIVVGKNKDILNLKQRVRVHTGAVISPFNAWLINRGLATLPLRMKAHSENAIKLAEFLENHHGIERVIYPGLPSHPQYELAKSQMDSYSGMFTFQVKDPGALMKRMNDFRIFHYAVSLGHHKSLIFYLPTKELQESTFRLTGEQLDGYRKYGGDGIFRVSVGLEDADDLIQDLDAVL